MYAWQRTLAQRDAQTVVFDGPSHPLASTVGAAFELVLAIRRVLRTATAFDAAASAARVGVGRTMLSLPSSIWLWFRQGSGGAAKQFSQPLTAGPSHWQRASSPIGSATYLYDAADRVTAINEYGSSGAALMSYAYTYDHAGNLTQEVDNGGTAVTYGYDADNELTSQGSATESYNATGNRNGTGYTTGSDNELTSDGTWNYTYNADGDMTQKVNISTGETWTYGYNVANQMISAVDKSRGNWHRPRSSRKWSSAAETLIAASRCFAGDAAAHDCNTC